MKTIYINNKPLVVCRTGRHQRIPGQSERSLCMPYLGKVKQLHQFVDLLEKDSRYDMIITHSANQKLLWSTLKSLFTPIIACGGIVENELGEILSIYRRGFWDLPKGKMEVGETKKQTAIREVEEETGVEGLELIEKIGKTYHVYGNSRVGRKLKISYWYLMFAQKQPLVAQTAEDITKAKWKSPEELERLAPETYPNIRDILQKYSFY